MTSRTTKSSPAEESVLIDSSRSRSGWSRIGSAWKCRQLYAWQEVAGYSLIPADALTAGSMGHTAAAHYFARVGCEQGGVIVDKTFFGPHDHDRLLEPEAAIEAWVEKEKRGADLVAMVVEAWRRYRAKNPEPPGRILAVETQVEATLGTAATKRGPEWGLWLTGAAPELLGDRTLPSLVEITPLDCPNHPRHGQPIRLTRRLDLVFRSDWGDVFVYDHKFVSTVNPDSAKHSYGMDGGFRSQAILASQAWPDFAGVFANLIGKRSPWRSEPVPIPRSLYREARFARNLFDVEHEIARLEVETWAGERDVSEWPAADEETTCTGRYAGGCQAYHLCFGGPEGAGYRGPDENR